MRCGCVLVARAPRHVPAPRLVVYVVTAKMTILQPPLRYSSYNTMMAFPFACLPAVVVLPPRGQKTPVLLRVLEPRRLVWAGLTSLPALRHKARAPQRRALEQIPADHVQAAL